MTVVGTRVGLAGDPFARLDRIKAALMGGPLESTQRHRFSRYLDLLLLWNKTQRLTGFRTAADIIERLFVDSLLFLSQIPHGPLKVADIGAGAGIPGLPLRIVRQDVKLTLIESMRKRVSFLSTIKRELDLQDIDILEGRAEHLVQEFAGLSGAFDVVVTRAMPRASEIRAAVMRYLKPGGLFVMGGPPPGKAGPPIKDAEYRAVDLPGLGVRRAFLVFGRTEACIPPRP